MYKKDNVNHFGVNMIGIPEIANAFNNIFASLTDERGRKARVFDDTFYVYDFNNPIIRMVYKNS